MSKKAMKLALEALEAGEYYIDDLEAIVYAADDLGTHEDRAKMQAAITVLRLEIDALNMASKTVKRDFWDGYVPEPAQQKPVTRVNLDMTGAMATLPKTGSESVVEYKPVDEHVCIYNECGFCEDPDCNVHGDADVQVTMPPMTNEGADANTSLALPPKGTGKTTLHESKPAQQALDKKAENARELGLDYEPVCNKDPQGCWNVRCQLGKKCKNTSAQQEPVAWRELLREARDNCKASIVEEGISASRKEYRIDLEARLTAALNTSPPAQRTWVGLTNNELQPIADEHRILFGGWVEDFARAIEAKLRSKNEDRN